jgi:antitoxin (DNA-binding transcriptional repressor) of toxin-antitoxin stability system
MQGIQVSKTEFKAKALEYFRQIEQSGEHVVVTDHGKPALVVSPFHGLNRDPLEILSGTVVRYDNPTDPIDVEWEAGQ